MKPTKKIIMTFALAAFAAGCDKPSTTSQQMDKVAAETKEAAHDLKDYSYAQKAEFVAKRQNQLDEINRELDQLAVKIEKSSDAAKAEARPKYQALREKADRLGKQLDEVRKSSESTWDSVKAGSAKAYDELKDSFSQARQWLSDKIAP
jgi:DNA anti-recombination protein RmuC